MMQYNDNYPTVFIPVSEGTAEKLYNNLGVISVVDAIAEIASKNGVNIEINIQRDYFVPRAENYRSMTIAPETTVHADTDTKQNKNPLDEFYVSNSGGATPI